MAKRFSKFKSATHIGIVWNSTIKNSESGHDSLETFSEVALQFWREENLDIGDHRSD